MSLSPCRKQRLQSILEQLGRLSVQQDGSNEKYTDAMATSTALAARGREAGEAVAASPRPPLPLYGNVDEIVDSDIFLGDENGADVGGSNDRIPCGGKGKSASTGAIRSDKQSRTNLFISNIPHNMEHNDLKKMFAPYGEILSAAVMRNIHTGDSLGTAFVRYATTEQAEMAIAGLTGKKFDGKTMIVQWAKRQHDGTPVGEARRKISKLFVRNIPLNISVCDLTELFGRYGPIKSVSIHKDTTPDVERNSERHIAFITFLVDCVAERAAEAVHNTRPFPSCGRVPLMVKLAEDTPQHSHHNSSGNSSLNSSLRGNKRAQRGGRKPSPGQVRLSATSTVRGVYPVGSDVNIVPGVFPVQKETSSAPGVLPVGNDSSNLPNTASAFFPSVMPSGGFFVPPAFPGIGMGNGHSYPMRTHIIWPQTNVVPMTIPEAAAAAATDSLGLRNPAINNPYYQPPVAGVGSGGFAAFPVYAPPFYPMMAQGFGDAGGGGMERLRGDATTTTTTTHAASVVSSAPRTYTTLLPDSAASMIIPPSTSIVTASSAKDVRTIPMFLDDEEDVDDDINDLAYYIDSHMNTGTAFPRNSDGEETSALSAMEGISHAIQAADEHCSAALNIFGFPPD